MVGPPNKRRRHILRLALLKKTQPSREHEAEVIKIGDESQSDVESDDVYQNDNDEWCQDYHDGSSPAVHPAILVWKEGAGSHLRKAHDGTGRSTKFARLAEKRKRERSMAGCKTLMSYFGQGDEENITGERPYDGKNPIDQSADIDQAINTLKEATSIRNNVAIEKRNKKSQFEFVRHLCVLRYLQQMKESPRSKVSTSLSVARMIFGPDKGTDYRAKSIREWSDEFVRSGSMMVLRQGKHRKTRSLIDDNDIRFACLAYLRNERAELIDGETFARWVSENLHKQPELTLDEPVRIQSRTAVRWLHSLGFHSEQYKKGTYTDGHERPDVVEHRKRSVAHYVKRILSLSHGLQVC